MFKKEYLRSFKILKKKQQLSSLQISSSFLITRFKYNYWITKLEYIKNNLDLYLRKITNYIVVIGSELVIKKARFDIGLSSYPEIFILLIFYQNDKFIILNINYKF